MNPQERQELSLFLQQLAGAQVAQKDAEADALIREACERQPNAAYLLVQRTMILEQALRSAQDRINHLQAELDRSRPGIAFLGDANAWGRAPVSQGASMPPRAPSAAGSFLGNIATTAAGVVAGSFLFQGIESLLGHHSGGAWGAGSAANLASSVPENVTLENPSDDASQESDEDTDLADASDDFDDGGSDDIA